MATREECSDNWDSCHVVLSFVTEGVLEDLVCMLSFVCPKLMMYLVHKQSSKTTQAV